MNAVVAMEDIIMEDVMIGAEMTTVVAIPETVAIAEITITQEIIMDVAKLIEHIMSLTDDMEEQITTIEKKIMMIVVWRFNFVYYFPL